MTGPPADHWGFFLVMAVTSGLVLFDFAVFREQMCTIACPYARFQSVLMDEDSMIVSYDPHRGEPRGKGKARGGLGDCVDCLACVRTCPTGIDIRDGLQMECVACTQCIDACDAIMLKTGQAPGLIRYTSERALEGLPTRRLRPRTALYGGLLVAVAAMFTVALVAREPFDVNVGRATGAPFMTMPDGTVSNRLVFRVRNQTPEPVAFSIGGVEPAAMDLRVVGRQPIALAPQEMTRVEVFVMAPPEAFGGRPSREATFRLAFGDGREEDVTFPLLGPSR
jgi:cytochrome c oxidase accessory protein FixG